MQEKIKLKYDPHGDSRNAPKDTTFEQFHAANLSHIGEVRMILAELAGMLKHQGEVHDWTKLKFEEEF